VTADPDRRAFLRGAALAAPLLGVPALGVPALLGVPPASAATSVALTSRQRAGQRVVFSYPGPTVPVALLNQVAAGAAAGVIFFRENIPSTVVLADAVQQLRAAQQRSPVQLPLLLTTDQEGGLVRRLPGAPEQSARQVGSSPDPAAAASAAGSGAGSNLLANGLGVNLAPVLDVFDQPGNFIDAFQRSFGSDPAVVAACGAAFVAAQRSAGVAATLKHFPGLGAAEAGQDTDLGPVRLDVALDVLRGRHEAPYVQALAAGAGLVMTSWATYPALDSLPAGLSPVVVRQELRGRLAFRGVTVTDALEAGALAAYGGTAARARRAAAAGMDLLLCSARDVRQGQAAVTSLAQALDHGALPAPAFTAAVRRVQALRATLH